MKLSRQLELMLLAVFLIIYIGTLWVNLANTQFYLNTQLESHAQDTSSFLGIAISRQLQDGDSAAMETLANALFDRGDYKEITIESYDGIETIERKTAISVEKVPQWFINFFTLETPRKHSEIMQGWNRIGKVYVQSHPGYAYSVLWKSTIRLFIFYSALFIAFSLAGIFILRRLLKPLKQVVEQAKALSRREYIIQKDIPKTHELKVIVESTNLMTSSIQGLFEIQARNTQRLKELAYKDPLTGFHNRRHFEAQLKCNLLALPNEKHCGALLLIQIHKLEEINRANGFEAGDQLLIKASNLIKTSLKGISQHIIGRMAGATFAILLPHLNSKEAESIAQVFCEKLPTLYSKQYTLSADVAHIGICIYQSGQDAHDVLSDADAAMREAQAKGMNTWKIYAASSLGEIQLRHERMSIIANVISQESIVLFAQSVVDTTDEQNIMHSECLMRIPTTDGKLQSAEIFIPIAEQVGLARELDKQVLKKLIDYLNSDVKNNNKAIFSMNLSLTAFEDPKFVKEIYDLLATIKTENKRIIFEVTEYAVIHNTAFLKSFVKKIQTLGHGFSIDHFGNSYSDFGYFHSLKPDYVKLDKTYASSILEDEDSQFFVDGICQICHHQNIKAIAVGVERDDQLLQFKNLGIDGIQGFIAGEPVKLLNNDNHSDKK